MMRLFSSQVKEDQSLDQICTTEPDSTDPGISFYTQRILQSREKLAQINKTMDKRIDGMIKSHNYQNFTPAMSQRTTEYDMSKNLDGSSLFSPKSH
jgi:hypothetical protein